MSDIKLSILVVTTGRPSLRRTLQSIKDQGLLPGDEVIVVCDGVSPEAKQIWTEFGLHGVYYERTDGPHHDWGHSTRNHFMSSCMGTHILHMDDDDYYLPNAFVAVRDAVSKDPQFVHLFSVKTPAGNTLTYQPGNSIVAGTVSTLMVVQPNVAGKLGSFDTTVYEGDVGYVKTVIERNGFPPVSHTTVIARISNATDMYAPIGSLDKVDMEAFSKLAPWHTRFRVGDGDFLPSQGSLCACADNRLHWFRKHFPNPGRVLELGCMEGGFTFEIARSAKEVVAIDARDRNLQKAHFMSNVYGLKNITFTQGDIEEKGLLTSLGGFDTAFVVGILYHLSNPFSCIYRLADIVDNLFVWTHVAKLNKYTISSGGEWVNRDGSDLGCLAPRSFWMTEPTLRQTLYQAGFENQTVIEHKTQENGVDSLHHITLVAKKR